MKIFIVLLAIAVAGEAFRYDGYQVFEIGPLTNPQQVSVVQSLIDTDIRLKQIMLMNDAVTESVPIDVIVAPGVSDRFTEIMNDDNIPFKITNADLQKTFDKNMLDGRQSLEHYSDEISTFDHDAYLRYDEQVAWLQNAAANSAIASLVPAGNSYAGRTMYVLTINDGNNGLPGIWIDAGIHAREWIAQATTLYIIDQILTGTSADAVYLRTNYRWYFLPNVNPDGYEYTWTNDRMWRKTRKPNNGFPNCPGTDANRNWDSNWCGEGASSNPCSDTYCGTSAFSEAETQNARNYMISIKSFTNLMISIHSYSQYWLIPWGGYSYKPADYPELLRVGNLARDAIQSVNGLNFVVGTPPDILYVASGGTLDWAKASNEMAYSYSPELRPQNAGGSFDIPPSNIVPSGNEIFAAINACARNVVHKL